MLDEFLYGVRWELRALLYGALLLYVATRFT